jgi:hypothetical protein
VKQAAVIPRRHISARIRKHRVIRRVLLSVRALDWKTNLLEQNETTDSKETKNQEQRKSD